MTEDQMWNDERAIAEIEGLDIEVPAWIEQDISPSNVAAIVQGGCASGAYMPAVRHSTAAAIMGSDVLQYIEDALDELPQPVRGVSWPGIAVFYLSIAVELWASAAYATLEDFEPEVLTTS